MSSTANCPKCTAKVWHSCVHKCPPTGSNTVKNSSSDLSPCSQSYLTHLQITKFCITRKVMTTFWTAGESLRSLTESASCLDLNGTWTCYRQRFIRRIRLSFLNWSCRMIHKRHSGSWWRFYLRRGKVLRGSRGLRGLDFQPWRPWLVH